MKSISNRHRPPRMLYKLDDWAKKRNDELKTGGSLKVKKNKPKKG